MIDKETENRITTLETQHDNLIDKILEIKDNHLTHLAADVKDLQKGVQAIDLKLAYWSGAIVVAIYVIQTLTK